MRRGVMLLTLAVGTAPAWADDWPQWRGPRRDAVSTEKGLLDRWTDQAPPLAWQAGGLGRGYSSVAIAGGRIFTLGQRKGGTELLALDLETGKELWATRVGG